MQTNNFTELSKVIVKVNDLLLIIDSIITYIIALIPLFLIIAIVKIVFLGLGDNFYTPDFIPAKTKKPSFMDFVKQRDRDFKNFFKRRDRELEDYYK